MKAPPAGIKTRIRSILTRHWLNPNQVTIICTSGAVRLSGTLRKLPGAPREEVNEQLVAVIEAEIRQLKGVKRVHMGFAD